MGYNMKYIWSLFMLCGTKVLNPWDFLIGVSCNSEGASFDGTRVYTNKVTQERAPGYSLRMEPNRNSQVIKKLGLLVPFFGGDEVEIKLCKYSETRRFGKLSI